MLTGAPWTSIERPRASVRPWWAVIVVPALSAVQIVRPPGATAIATVRMLGGVGVQGLTGLATAPASAGARTWAVPAAARPPRNPRRGRAIPPALSPSESATVLGG